MVMLEIPEEVNKAVRFSTIKNADHNCNWEGKTGYLRRRQS